MDALYPPNENGTPTYMALQGTIDYAQTLVAEGHNTAIVLVTDGEPYGCDNMNVNTIDNAATAAAKVEDEIATYVIGINEVTTKLESLSLIAAAGGTETAFIVDTEDPSASQNALLNRIEEIHKTEIVCELKIPSPPNGEMLNIDKVNVRITVNDNTLDLLKDGECISREGWRYDDPANPTTIRLCEDTCDALKLEQNVEINVMFGCQTRVIVI
jgi:hypothetical protein